MKGGNIMKHKHSKIGEYGIRCKPVEGYKTNDGKKSAITYDKSRIQVETQQLILYLYSIKKLFTRFN